MTDIHISLYTYINIGLYNYFDIALYQYSNQSACKYIILAFFELPLLIRHKYMAFYHYSYHEINADLNIQPIRGIFMYVHRYI